MKVASLAKLGCILIVAVLVSIVPRITVADDGEVTINGTFLCRVTSSVSVLVKKGTELSETQAQRAVSKATKALKTQKALLSSAKEGGNQTLIDKLKGKVSTAKSLKQKLKACLKGDLQPTPASFPLEARGGNYLGTWSNTTFNSSGPISLTLTSTTTQFTLVLDLGGSVFGLTDPAAETFEGTFTGAAPYVFTFNSSPLFGDNVEITVSADGDLEFDAPDPPATAISDFSMSFDFDDTNDSAAITYSLKAMTIAVVGTGTLSRLP